MFSSSTSKLQKVFFAFSVGAAVLAMNQGASAAVKTWDGDNAAIDTNWTDGVNWDNNAAPAAGDSLIFAGAAGLAPNNDFPAATQFNGISFAAGSGAFTLGGAAINLGGNILDSATTAQVIGLDMALLQDTAFTVNSGSLRIGTNVTATTTPFPATGVISGTGFSLTKLGTGNLILSRINTYTGATVATAGTLTLDLKSANNNTSTSPVGVTATSSQLTTGNVTISTIGGDRTATSGTPAYVQTFGALNVGVGAVNFIQTRGSSARTINTFNGTATRVAGGTANFTDVLNLAGTNNANTGGYRMATSANVNGVVPYVTYNTTSTAISWFVAGGTGVNGTAYTAFTSSAADTLGTATQNSTVVGDVTFAAGGGSINTVRFNNAASNVVTIGTGDTLAINAGGILITPAVGNNTPRITGGTLVGGTPITGGAQDLIIHNYNNPASGTSAAFQIDSVIADNTATGASNTATALTKAGEGSLILTGANTYTGGTFVNAGALVANNTTGSATSSGPVTVSGGSTLATLSTTDARTAVSVYGALSGGNGAANGGLLSPTTGGAALRTYVPNAVGIIAGPVTINASGHLAPGNITGLTVASGTAVLTGAVGTLTVASLNLNASVVLDYEFNATANDFTRVVSNGGLTLGGPISFNLFQEGTNSAYTVAGTYNLLGYSGTLNGSVSSLTVANAQAGMTYTFNNDVADGLIQVVIAVPEPSTWAMLASGLGLLLVGRLVRRKIA